MIVSFSALGIGLYLFYRKKVIAQFKKRERNDIHRNLKELCHDILSRFLFSYFRFDLGGNL